jgi:hypothetical protein
MRLAKVEDLRKEIEILSQVRQKCKKYRKKPTTHRNINKISGEAMRALFAFL